MKRITYWPQLFLGITFNWGLIMAWTAMGNAVSQEIIILYFSAIFWTLGYDTIYGAQDISDDEIIGLKSTAIKFKKNIKKFVTMSYLITGTCLVLSLAYQILKFNENNPSSCLQIFKLNNFSGLFLFLGIYLINT